MFAISTKVKIAAGIAAGALTLGAAGAYAATANNTITVTNPTPITLGSGSNQLKLISLNGQTLTAPKFDNVGKCVSWLAQNKNIALAPQGTTSGPLKLSKNYHGKLMSGANAWCKTQVGAKTDSAENETADVEQSAAPETESSDSNSGSTDAGASHGHGHGHSQGKAANETD